MKKHLFTKKTHKQKKEKKKKEGGKQPWGRQAETQVTWKNRPQRSTTW